MSRRRLSVSVLDTVQRKAANRADRALGRSRRLAAKKYRGPVPRAIEVYRRPAPTEPSAAQAAAAELFKGSKR